MKSLLATIRIPALSYIILILLFFIGGTTSQTGSERGTPAIYAATFSPAEVHEQLNCVCGNCSLTVANCSCDFAEEMKYQVARAIREGKTQNEILNLMVKKYGSKVLVDKAGLAK
jgi:cytochrome c-type biogenesis protein CcmH/NrfF